MIPLYGTQASPFHIYALGFGRVVVTSAAPQPTWPLRDAAQHAVMMWFYSKLHFARIIHQVRFYALNIPSDVSSLPFINMYIIYSFVVIYGWWCARTHRPSGGTAAAIRDIYLGRRCGLDAMNHGYLDNAQKCIAPIFRINATMTSHIYFVRNSHHIVYIPYIQGAS